MRENGLEDFLRKGISLFLPYSGFEGTLSDLLNYVFTYGILHGGLGVGLWVL